MIDSCAFTHNVLNRVRKTWHNRLMSLSALVLGGALLPYSVEAAINDYSYIDKNVLSPHVIKQKTAQCEQGNDREACSTLGVHYLVLAIDHNLDVDINMKLAIYNLEKSCSSGLQSACMILGNALGMYGNFFISDISPNLDLTQGKALLERGCELRDAYACAQLGLIYYEGKGIPIDQHKAEALFEQSCHMAQEKPEHIQREDNNIGMGCLYAGRALLNRTNPDIYRGLYYLNVSCDMYTPFACSELANYYHGIGDFEKANYYTHMSCLTGNTNVCLQSAIAMHAQNDDGLANFYLYTACNQGNGDSCTLLASNMMEGNMTEQAQNDAYDMLTASCDRNNALACYYIAELYEKGVPPMKAGEDPNKALKLNRSIATAREYYRKSCSLGNKSACNAYDDLTGTNTQNRDPNVMTIPRLDDGAQGESPNRTEYTGLIHSRGRNTHDSTTPSSSPSQEGNP